MNTTKVVVTTSVANSATSTIFNSTYGLTTATTATGVGDWRSRYAGYRVVGSVTTGNQAVTLRLSGLENGAWVTIQDTTVAATNTQTFDFLPRHPDYRVIIVNGATGPSTLVAEAYLVKDDRSAGA